MTTPVAHEWFHRRMAVYAVNLLPQEEEGRFLEHRAACAACRTEYDAFEGWERPPGDAWQDRHIPSALLAHWDRARDEIRGLELSAATEHLETCELCQDGLRVANLVRHAALASEPQLSVAGRRGDVTESLSALRLPTRSAAPAVAPVAPRATRDRRSWALGTWAALATAAAVTLAVVRPGTEPAPGPVASLPVQGSTTQVAPPRTSPSPGIAVALLPRSAEPLRAVARDAGDSRVRVRRIAGTNVLVVRIEPFLMMEDSQRVALEILDEKRRVLASTRVMWRDLHGGRDVLVDAAPGLLPAGEYTLRVRPLNTGASSDGDAVHLPFAITESD